MSDARSTLARQAQIVRILKDGHGSRFSCGQWEALVWYDEP